MPRTKEIVLTLFQQVVYDTFRRMGQPTNEDSLGFTMADYKEAIRDEKIFVPAGCAEQIGEELTKRGFLTMRKHNGATYFCVSVTTSPHTRRHQKSTRG